MNEFVERKVQTEEKTYTMQELMGRGPRWFCYLVPPADVTTFCGDDRNINKIPITQMPKECRVCPDCVRNARARGFRV
jgi:hypothetical protein